MNDFFAYLEKLELIAFFAGFPLIYFLVMAYKNQLQSSKYSFLKQIPNHLSFGYALAVLLYAGMKVYQQVNNQEGFHLSNLFIGDNRYYIIWAYAGLIFWLPFLKAKPILALLHSLVFFFLFLFFIYLYINGEAEKAVVTNSTQLYLYSILLNGFTVLFVTTLHLIFSRNKKTTA